MDAWTSTCPKQVLRCCLLASSLPFPLSLEKILLSKQPKGHTVRMEEETCPIGLNIVIQVVGSRGDIQPFIVIGKALKQYGHRVRLATHLTFRNPVKENGLDFFDIGEHPPEIMTFMVENTGLLPQFKTIRSGAVNQR